MASGAPFSIARIGSTSPLPMLTLMALTTTCWMVALFDCEKTRSILISASAKNPFLVPIKIGHRFADAELTPPAMIVSAARGWREHERGYEQQYLRRAGEHRHGEPPISHLQSRA